jgi:hypothetical protein
MTDVEYKNLKSKDGVFPNQYDKDTQSAAYMVLVLEGVPFFIDSNGYLVSVGRFKSALSVLPGHFL